MRIVKRLTLKRTSIYEDWGLRLTGGWHAGQWIGKFMTSFALSLSEQSSCFQKSPAFLPGARPSGSAWERGIFWSKSRTSWYSSPPLTKWNPCWNVPPIWTYRFKLSAGKSSRWLHMGKYLRLTSNIHHLGPFLLIFILSFAGFSRKHRRKYRKIRAIRWRLFLTRTAAFTSPSFTENKGEVARFRWYEVPIKRIYVHWS